MSMERASLFNLCMCTRRLRMGEKSYSFFKIQKKKQGKKSLSRWTIQKKKSPELVFPTTYLALMVLEATRHLQPITGSGTGSTVNSSL